MRRRLLLLLLCSCTLSACGGGNGGGGSGVGSSPNRAPPPPVITYGGTSAPYDFARQDVYALASAMIAVRPLVRLAESAWIPDRVQGRVNRTISGNSGTANVTGEIAADLSGYIVVDYDQFTVDGQTIDGRYIQRFNADDGTFPDAFDTPINGSAEFSDLAITVGGITLRITGVLQSAASGQSSLTANLLIVDAASGDAAWLDNITFSRSRWTQPDGGPDGIATLINGRLYDSALGYVDLEQSAPFRYADAGNNVELYPIAGDGLFARGPTLRLELRPLSETYAALVVDNDNAQFEALRTTWNALEAPAAPVPAGRPPVANAGADFNARPNQRVVPHALFSHDDDGDFLSFQWELLVKPLDSSAALESAITPYAPFVPDAAGEYLLKVSVNDGANVASAITRVLADADFPEAGPFGTVRGAIEGTSRGSAGELLSLSADSWYRTSAERQQGSDFWSILSVADLGPAAFSFSSQTESAIDFSFSAPSITIISYDGPRYSTDLRPGRAINVDAGPVGESALLYSPTGFSEEIATADFNGDGLDDLIARVPFDAEDFDPSAREIDGLAIFFANPNGGFDPAVLRRGGSGGIAVGDFSGDGLDDIVVTGLLGIYVLRQAADGVVGTPEFLAYPRTMFCGSTTTPLPGSETQPLVADVFGDGLADIITLSPCTGEIVVWQQLSATELDTGRPTVTDVAEANAAFGDIDGDGQLDAVFGLNGTNNPGGPRAVVYTRNALGSLRQVADLGGACENADEPFGAIADVNADQRQDVIVVSGCEIAVHYQESDGSFSAGPVTEAPELPGRLVRVTQDDYDSDGDPDLFIIGSSLTRVFAFLDDDGTYRIAYDNTQRNFVPPILMDFDRNGTNDLLSSSAGNRISVAGPGGETWPLAQIMLNGL